eukprot:jgi/Chlat1/8140/Chrsp75S07597
MAVAAMQQLPCLGCCSSSQTVTTVVYTRHHRQLPAHPKANNNSIPSNKRHHQHSNYFQAAPNTSAVITHHHPRHHNNNNSNGDNDNDNAHDDGIGPSGSLLYQEVDFDWDNSGGKYVYDEDLWRVGAPLHGYPKQVEGPSVWYGSQLEAQRDRWVFAIEPEDIRELDAALATFHASSRPLIALAQPRGRELFPLYNLRTKLRRIHNATLLGGIGLALLRGLPVDRYSREDLAAVYLGIGSHMGVPMSQNAKGHLLGHVRDLGHDPLDPNTRIYATRERQCVSSSHTIYNSLLHLAPHLAATLVKGLFFDRKGEIPHGKQPFYEASVFIQHQGRVYVRFDRNFVVRAHTRGAPRLTQEQRRAIDAVEQLARRHAISMSLQPGDIQFLHSHHTLHARESFLDSPSHPPRHLLRLWLSLSGQNCPNAWGLPKEMEEHFGPAVEGGARAGIRVPGQELKVPLEPE